MGVLIPAYFHPTAAGSWQRLNDAAAQIPLIAILNPNSGPGAMRDPSYVKAVNELRRCGGSVVGYVSSSYTQRSFDLVKQDIDLYRSFYAIDGIFVDEMTADDLGAHVQYYRRVYDYIKSLDRKYRVITNPGTQVEEIYARTPCADILVTFESDNGYPFYSPSGWTSGYSPDRFCHLVYDVASAAVMTNYVHLADTRRAAWVYITDDKGANPWDRLPAYWESLVQSIKSRNDLTAQGSRLTWTVSANAWLSISNEGPPGLYVTQVSSNLGTWISTNTNKSTTGSFLVTNVSVIPSSQSYYRVFR